MKKDTPLVLPKTDYDIKVPFEGDILNRKPLADRITGYIDRLRAGAVLSIDASWGEGKTWFGRHWSKQLSEQGHKVVFIDAFEQDYAEDPFLLIAAEIAEALNDDKGTAQSLREKAANVMKAILPVGTKAMINLAGRVALGSTDMSKDIKSVAEAVTGSTADAASKWIEKKLEDHAQEKASLQHFKIELAKFTASQPKPVVLFIDELDRCRPDFAVRLIERAKHFFDVPNLVFVLLMNRSQLEKAVKGVYGQETDASGYLDKFVHIFLRLPKDMSRNKTWDEHRLSAFIQNVLGRYNFDLSQTGHINEFRNYLSVWAINFDMSLRDIERACTLFAMSDIHGEIGFLAYLIMLKIKHSALYARLVRNEVVAHKEASELLSPLISKKGLDENDWYAIYFKCLQEVHQVEMGVDTSIQTPYLNTYISRLFGSRQSYKRAFAEFISRIDLPIENW